MIKKSKFFDNVINIAILISIGILYLLNNKNPNILFIGNIIICIIICLRAKLSIYSLKVIVVNYILLAVFFQYNTGKSYGVLEKNYYVLNYDIMNSLILIYTTILNFYLINSNYLKYEKEKQTQKIEFSKTTSIFMGVIAIIFAIVAFPNFNGGGTRFDSLLPGSGWNHVTVIALLLAYPNLTKSTFAKISYAFCIIWFLFQGERVDMIGLLTCLMLIIGVTKFKDIDKNKLIKISKYLIVGVCVCFIMVYIGEKRNGVSNINFSTLIRKAVVQNTATDLGYVYNISIKYRLEKGLLYGSTYKYYIDEAIPFKSGVSAGYLLDKEYWSPGGMFILSEPYMNFGIMGVIIFAVIEIITLQIITKRKTKYCYFLYLYILATVFRTSWYGISYIETGVLYLLPALFIFANNIDHKSKKEAI